VVRHDCFALGRWRVGVKDRRAILGASAMGELWVMGGERVPVALPNATGDGPPPTVIGEDFIALDWARDRPLEGIHAGPRRAGAPRNGGPAVLRLHGGPLPARPCDLGLAGDPGRPDRIGRSPGR